MKPPSRRSVGSIIEHQIKQWSLQQQEREAAARAQLEHWPIVTISREFGSLGARVGFLASQRLGFTFWDQELVQTIAEQTGAQETLLESLDESARSKVEEFVAHLVFGSSGTAAEYVRQVARVVRTLDRQGGAVVVGRGAQFILEPDRMLRVRVSCTWEHRVKGYAEREGLSQKEAEAAIEMVERERHGFIKQHYKQDISDPANYDLVVNTATLSLEAAAEVVIAAYRAKFGRLPPAVE